MKENSPIIKKFCLGYIIIVVAIVWTPIASAQVENSPVVSEQVIQHNEVVEDQKEKERENIIDLKTVHREFFKRVFKTRRKEQLQAVKNLKSMDNYERQYKMIIILAQKMFDVIENNKVILENFMDSETELMSFSTNMTEEVRDAISGVLENIAFFSDIVLNLPDMTHRILKTQPKWKPTIDWSYEFLNKTRDWLDDRTLEMFDLVLQELNIVERKPDYVNPNRITTSSDDSEKKRKAQKKEKRRKGPTLTRIDL